jgi:hypothetical protein
MPRYRVTISSLDREAMLDLVRQHHISVLDHGIRTGTLGGYQVDAIVEDADIHVLKSHGYAIEQHEDVDEAGKDRQREVGEGDRYRQRPEKPPSA